MDITPVVSLQMKIEVISNVYFLLRYINAAFSEINNLTSNFYQMNCIIFYHVYSLMCLFSFGDILKLSSHCCGIFALHLSEITCQSDSVGVHCDVLYVEFLWTEVSVGVTPICLFGHVGYCCSMLMFTKLLCLFQTGVCSSCCSSENISLPVHLRICFVSPTQTRCLDMQLVI